MTEETIWDDQAREDLRESLRERILGEVRLANLDEEDILTLCQEVYIEDECPDEEWELFVDFSAEVINETIDRIETEKQSWPEETDCDRLDRVEAALRERGILLWQVSPCCDTCSGAELPDRIDVINDRFPGFREKVRGYSFFIEQNMPEMLAESTEISVYMAYGWFAPEDAEISEAEYEKQALAIGREVCECLREQGFEADWDGDFSRKIGVTLNWQRREMLE